MAKIKISYFCLDKVMLINSNKMKKIRISPILYIIILVLFASCNSDESIKGYNASEILVVTVNIEDHINIEKIVLDFEFKEKIMSSKYSHYYNVIKKNDIGDNKTFKLKIPLKNLTRKKLTGSQSVCIYTNSGDIICSDKTYCSGGDRVELTFRNGEFK